MSKNTLKKQIEQALLGKIGKVVNNDGFQIFVNDRRQLNHVMNVEKSNLPIFLLITGTSESGKSYMGEEFVKDGVGHRFKIYKTISDLVAKDIKYKDQQHNFDAVALMNTLSSRDERNAIIKRVINLYTKNLQKSGLHIAIIETIKNPWIVDEMRKVPSIRTLTLFIDAYLKLRVERQMVVEKTSFQTVFGRVSEKDRQKQMTGTFEIKSHADIVILNNGTIVEYNTFIETLQNTLKHYSGQISGKAKDFADK